MELGLLFAKCVEKKDNGWPSETTLSPIISKVSLFLAECAKDLQDKNYIEEAQQQLPAFFILNFLDIILAQ